MFLYFTEELPFYSSQQNVYICDTLLLVHVIVPCVWPSDNILIRQPHVECVQFIRNIFMRQPHVECVQFLLTSFGNCPRFRTIHQRRVWLQNPCVICCESWQFLFQKNGNTKIFFFNIWVYRDLTKYGYVIKTNVWKQ